MPDTAGTPSISMRVLKARRAVSAAAMGCMCSEGAACLGTNILVDCQLRALSMSGSGVSVQWCTRYANKPVCCVQQSTATWTACASRVYDRGSCLSWEKHAAATALAIARITACQGAAPARRGPTAGPRSTSWSHGLGACSSSDSGACMHACTTAYKRTNDGPLRRPGFGVSDLVQSARLFAGYAVSAGRSRLSACIEHVQPLEYVIKLLCGASLLAITAACKQLPPYRRRWAGRQL